MGQITIRFDEHKDTALWAAIQAIPSGQRTAHLKRLLETGLRMGQRDVLQRLDDLERRLAAWEQGGAPPQSLHPAPQAPATKDSPVTIPPGWKDSLAQLGAFDE